jgi:hypothetical protein
MTSLQEQYPGELLVLAVIGDILAHHCAQIMANDPFRVLKKYDWQATFALFEQWKDAGSDWSEDHP